MSTTFVESITLSPINCGECGGTYSINEMYRQQRAEQGGGWHCPYCQCGWGYFKNTENDRLKQQLQDKNNELQKSRMETVTERQMREGAERREAEAKRKVKRAEKGVCTCCNRSFSNLRRHMLTQHADNPELREAAIQLEKKTKESK